MSSMKRYDFDSIRERLRGTQGEELWRSLDELGDTEEFREWLMHEFPAGADVWLEGLSRRGFLKFAAASMALAGLTGCANQPFEPIVPYIDQPEGRPSGEPSWFATALPRRGFGTGVLVKSFEGRPVKIEGNPDHPASLGATDAIIQADLLGLYDPDRSQVVRKGTSIGTWDDFSREFVPVMERQRLAGGGGVRLLTQTVTSPTLRAQIESLLPIFPGARWHRYEPVNRDNVYAGTRLLFGRPLEPRYHFDRADVVVGLDSNFMTDDPGAVRYAREFSDRRRVDDPETSSMNRFYSIHSNLTVTGSMADHALPRKPSLIAVYARALAQHIAGVGGGIELARDDAHWIDVAARDLMAHRGRALIIAGEGQPPPVHALAHAMTAALGGIGSTVTYSRPVTDPESNVDSIRELAHDLDGGGVEVLVILGGNPVYDAPADLEFARRLAKVPMSVHWSLDEDETASKCRWHVPASHPLESWSDLRAWDGTTSIVQPLIAPLYDTRSAHELIGTITGSPMHGHDIIKGFWRTFGPVRALLPPSPKAGGAPLAPNPAAEGAFASWWRDTLARGVVAGSTEPDVAVTSDPAAIARLLGEPWPAIDESAIDVAFEPDPSILDGRYANNGWLQEVPKPITKLSWNNAALIGPDLAQRMNLANEQVLEIAFRGRTIEAPAWIVPGHADRAVTLHLGFGRKAPAQTAEGVGFDAYPIRFSDSMTFTSGADVRATERRRDLVSVQHHNTLAGRDHVRAATLDQYRREPDFVREPEKEPKHDETMYPPYVYPRYAWGMSIDLNSCIGCNACVMACVAENNVPIVGREQVERGREMHWLRIDRYWAGPLENPSTFHQPMLCMHCEDAPCEVVCPVGATVHSSEGLNEMIYNRCIGTRYCSNNCPYKVRRFNFLRYSTRGDEVMELMYNPDVTVRMRGVMEKCSYCVQRIERARIKADNAERPIADGEIVTACQQACPAQAIVFGNANDPQSKVKKLKDQKRDYGVLTELNTRPRTTYLAKLRNPNPELEKG